MSQNRQNNSKAKGSLPTGGFPVGDAGWLTDIRKKVLKSFVGFVGKRRTNNKTQNTMKKLALTLAIILGMGLTTFAQDGTYGGGLFQRGDTPHYDFYADWADLGWTRDGGIGLFNLPGQHGLGTDAPAPLGTGIAILAALSGAYLVAKRRKEG